LDFAVGLVVFQESLESVESVGPGLLEPGHPVVDRFERRTVDPVHPLASEAAAADEIHLPQHLEVLGHLRLPEPEPRHEFSDGEFIGAQHLEDFPPTRFRDGVESI